MTNAPRSITEPIITPRALSAFEQADMQRKLQLIADILTGDFDEWLAKQKAQWEYCRRPTEEELKER